MPFHQYLWGKQEVDASKVHKYYGTNWMESAYAKQNEGGGGLMA